LASFGAGRNWVCSRESASFVQNVETRDRRGREIRAKRAAELGLFGQYEVFGKWPIRHRAVMAREIQARTANAVAE
jgi:hypothetical protein